MPELRVRVGRGTAPKSPALPFFGPHGAQGHEASHFHSRRPTWQRGKLSCLQQAGQLAGHSVHRCSTNTTFYLAAGGRDGSNRLTCRLAKLQILTNLVIITAKIPQQFSADTLIDTDRGAATQRRHKYMQYRDIQSVAKPTDENPKSYRN